MPQWAKEFDAASKAYYYYNVETYETTWDKPADFQEDAGESLTVSEGMVMLKAVKRIQRGYRAKVARGVLRSKRAERKASQTDLHGCKWVATFDPGQGVDYYYHVDTHEVSFLPAVSTAAPVPVLAARFVVARSSAFPFVL